MVIPWKCGFKSIKSMVRVRFVGSHPTTPGIFPRPANTGSIQCRPACRPPALEPGHRTRLENSASGRRKYSTATIKWRPCTRASTEEELLDLDVGREASRSCSGAPLPSLSTANEGAPPTLIVTKLWLSGSSPSYFYLYSLAAPLSGRPTWVGWVPTPSKSLPIRPATGSCLSLVTLSITPLRKLTGQLWLIRYRRMLGLFAFFYAVLHFITYIWLDKFFDLHEMWPT